MCSAACEALALDDYRWNGHDFAFVFITDDHSRCNLAWADTARAMNFRFTIAANVKRGPTLPSKLTPAEIHQLWAEGFEIGQHGRTHGEAGLTSACAQPPRGSWKGYFLCPEPDVTSRMDYLKKDIERDTLAAVCDIPVSAIRVAAYPRHWHGKALIDSLEAEGFIGVRTGGRWDYLSDSNGEFTTMARNSWDGGISLYRISLADNDGHWFGNHSAVPPVHLTYEQFAAIAQPVINLYRASGGILVMYSHHLGDDNNSYGDINYGLNSGGTTKQDLAWMVDLVRANNGVVMTLGEAVAYYRARSHREVFPDGDIVWVPGPDPDLSPVGDLPMASAGLQVNPNPFNPRTQVAFELVSPASVRVAVFDLSGRVVSVLHDGLMDAGRQVLEWNGHDDAGRSQPSGAYLVRLDGPGRHESRAITLLK